MHEECMVVKTITIDLEAYETWPNTSAKEARFSRVVKEQFGRRRTGRPNTRYSRLTPSVTS